MLEGGLRMISVVRASAALEGVLDLGQVLVAAEMFSLMMTGLFRCLSTTTAIPWPTPMHIAAMP